MRLVVGYLPDRRGTDAVNLAATLAGARTASLDVVVVPPPADASFDMYSPDRAYHAAQEKQSREWLDAALASVPEGITARGVVRPAESITQGLIEAATDPAAGEEAEGIVVGASHSGVVGQIHIGSVAGALLHAAPVPVALAPVGYQPHPAITRITCALGRRQGAEALLDVAIAAAAARGVPLRIMTLIALDEDEPRRSERQRIAEEHADALRAKAAEQLPGDSVTSVVGTGRSLNDCVSRLDFEPSEMVLVGSSRLAGPRRVFLSATANRIARALPVPMVVVPRDYEVPR